MKDVSPLQRNVEKMVIAVAALLLVLTAAYFYVLDPFAVQRAGREVTPIEFENQLAESVEQLEQKLQTAEVPDRRIADYAEVFTRTFNDTIREANDALAILMLPGLSLDLVPDTVDTERQFALPSLPVVEDLRVRSGFAALDLAALSERDENAREQLLNLLDNPDPPDFRYVSVAGTFDFEQWNERLERTDIFPGWLRSKRGIGRVSLLRQTWNRDTNQWGETRRIDPLPTQTFFGTETSYTPAMAEDVLQEIRQRQEEIARPELPPTRRIDGGRTWFSPDLQASLSIDQRLRLDEINNTVAANEREIQELADRMNLDRVPPPPRETTGPEERFGPGGADATDQRRPSDAPRRRDFNQMNPDRVPPGSPRRDFDRRGTDFQQGGGDPLMGELRELQRENLRLRRERREILEAGGVDTEALLPAEEMPGERPAEDGTEPDAREQQEEAWFNNAVRIWAHDITVEPGRRYRYKLVASVANPLFFEDNLSPEQRQANRDRLLLRPDERALEEMPWSEPVEVDPVLQFFLVDGNVNAGLAQFEVWRPYNGRWVVGEFSLQPGDRIGGEG